MREFFDLFVHLLVKIAQLMRHGGARAIVAEKSAVKVACSVLRGRGGGNVTPLPDPYTGFQKAQGICDPAYEPSVLFPPFSGLPN